MSKKTMAEWWEEMHAAGEAGDTDDQTYEDTVESLYAKLGKDPAVDVSVDIIRKEMAAVYRDMRAGRIDCHDGTRLAYVLDLVRKAHESTVKRGRLEAIEKAMGLKSDSNPDWLGLPFDDFG